VVKFDRLISIIFLGSLHSPAIYSGSPFIELTTSSQKVIRQWDPPIIKWRYNPSGAPSNIQSIIETALNTWKTQSQSTVEFEFSGTTTNNIPVLDGYCDFLFNVNFQALGLPNNIIALTFRNGSITDTLRSKSDRILEDADIIVNPELSDLWITGIPTDPTQLDLNEIILHESGHLLGLAHSFLIDSVMYPAKPRTSSDPELKALYRVPKTTLAHDDSAWLSWLYPNSSFASSTGTIEGRVFYNDRPYVGAHIVAAKLNESDLAYPFYPSSGAGDLLVRGLQNVATFSEQNGYFKIPGLNPGSYVLSVQDGESFLNFSLSNVNDYLRQNRSVSEIPTAFYRSPDCGSDSILSLNDFTNQYNAAAAFLVGAGRSYCGVDFQAKTGESFCTNSPRESNSCGGGGCQVSENSKAFSGIMGILLSVAGLLAILVLHRAIATLPRGAKADCTSTFDPTDKDFPS